MISNKSKLTIGLDLGDRPHAVCLVNSKGQIVAEETMPNTGKLRAISQSPTKSERRGSS
jgi:hypothetical protein